MKGALTIKWTDIQTKIEMPPNLNGSKKKFKGIITNNADTLHHLFGATDKNLIPNLDIVFP